MSKDSFCAYVPSTSIENYRVAIGYIGSLAEIHFIEIEYNDDGVLIHFYNSKECKEITKQKFLKFKSNSEERYYVFDSNEKFINLLKEYKNQGCDYLHVQDCNCDACNLLPNNLYIFSFDVIRIVKMLFEQVKNIQSKHEE